ncbi:TPA: hypothetical protein DEP90_00675 [Patescibacteria group bacterium]|nr:hypothetical protein [Patescibacteria group bacterium]
MEDISKKEDLQKLVNSYEMKVLSVLDSFNLKTHLLCDHLGYLLHNSEEFDKVSKAMLEYSVLIKEVILHGRRIRVFKLKESLTGKFNIPKIEIFEPKQGLDPSELRYGIEHIAFTVKDWEEFILKDRERLPIVKEGSVGNSLFMKTEIINTIEIEFRNDRLGEE